MHPRAAAEAFEHGLHGDSVRAFPLAGLTPYAAHNRLLQEGFRCQRLPLVGHRSRTGELQYRKKLGLTTSREHASSEYVYAHADGGIVRIFPDRGPTVGFDELMELPVPFARRSLRKDRGSSGLGWDDEVAVVSEKGVVLPRDLRVQDGIRYDPSKRLHSYRLARSVFAEQCIPLKSSTVDVLPALPFVDARGLGGVGVTLAPRRDFWGIVEMIKLRAAPDPTIEVREREGDLIFFFAGDRDVRGKLIGSCIGLASLTIHRGAYVVSLDPIGYEPSVAALVEFVSALMPLMRGIVVRENVFGLDLSEAFTRFPSKVIEAIDPTFAIGLLAAAKA